MDTSCDLGADLLTEARDELQHMTAEQQAHIHALARAFRALLRVHGSLGTFAFCMVAAELCVATEGASADG